MIVGESYLFSLSYVIIAYILKIEEFVDLKHFHIRLHFPAFTGKLTVLDQLMYFQKFGEFEELKKIFFFNYKTTQIATFN